MNVSRYETELEKEILKRLQEFVKGEKFRKYTNKRIAKATHYSTSSVCKILKGKQKLTLDFLDSFFRNFCNKSQKNFILTGEKNQLQNNSMSHENKDKFKEIIEFLNEFC